MTPLDEIARLLGKYGHTPQALAVRSLAAREEMRVELEAFWADVAGKDLFGPTDSVATLALGGDSATPSPELERDRARLRHALWLVADDLSLRGVATPASESWRLALRAQLRKPHGAKRSS